MKRGLLQWRTGDEWGRSSKFHSGSRQLMGCTLLSYGSALLLYLFFLIIWTSTIKTFCRRHLYLLTSTVQLPSLQICHQQLVTHAFRLKDEYLKPTVVDLLSMALTRSCFWSLPLQMFVVRIFRFGLSAGNFADLPSALWNMSAFKNNLFFVWDSSVVWVHVAGLKMC